MPRHNGNTYKPRSRKRRVWLKKRGLYDLSQKESGTRRNLVPYENNKEQ